MTAVALKACHLSKHFGEGNLKTYAVRDACFEAFFGEIIFIVGPSGSGKTTLLSMISGILEPSSGQVFFKGKDLWSMSGNDLADFRLHSVGFVFQDYHLFPRLSSAENVAIPLILANMDWDKAISTATHYLEAVDLKNKTDLPPIKLSGGEQQRVAIARAIVSKPEILIFDEPTASLDGDTGKKVLEFIKSDILNSQCCIIIVTHDSRIFEFANAIMKMEDGKILGIERCHDER